MFCSPWYQPVPLRFLWPCRLWQWFSSCFLQHQSVQRCTVQRFWRQLLFRLWYRSWKWHCSKRSCLQYALRPASDKLMTVRCRYRWFQACHQDKVPSSFRWHFWRPDKIRRYRILTGRQRSFWFQLQLPWSCQILPYHKCKAIRPSQCSHCPYRSCS